MLLLKTYLKLALPLYQSARSSPSTSEAMVLILSQHLWDSLCAVPSAEILNTLFCLVLKCSRSRGGWSQFSFPQNCLFNCVFLQYSEKSLNWAPQPQRRCRNHLSMLHLVRKYVELSHVLKALKEVFSMAHSWEKDLLIGQRKCSERSNVSLDIPWKGSPQGKGCFHPKRNGRT